MWNGKLGILESQDENRDLGQEKKKKSGKKIKYLTKNNISKA